MEEETGFTIKEIYGKGKDTRVYIHDPCDREGDATSFNGLEESACMPPSEVHNNRDADLTFDPRTLLNRIADAKIGTGLRHARALLNQEE